MDGLGRIFDQFAAMNQAGNEGVRFEFIQDFVGLFFAFVDTVNFDDDAQREGVAVGVNEAAALGPGRVADQRVGCAFIGRQTLEAVGDGLLRQFDDFFDADGNVFGAVIFAQSGLFEQLGAGPFGDDDDFSPQFITASLDAADTDDSGRVDIADAVYSLMFLFLGGAPPSEPFTECATDMTIDSVPCRVYTPCE